MLVDTQNVERHTEEEPHVHESVWDQGPIADAVFRKKPRPCKAKDASFGWPSSMNSMPLHGCLLDVAILNSKSSFQAVS